jgi:hypothetical protein
MAFQKAYTEEIPESLMEELNQSFKSLVESWSCLSKDVLHVYAGVFFYLIWVLIFKGRNQVICLFLILTISLLNEALDISYSLKQGSQANWGESLSDIFNTVFLPVVIFLFLKFMKWKKMD